MKRKREHFRNMREDDVPYYLKKGLAVHFEKALERVREELQKEGFGVLTEIDVQDTLKKKLGIEFRKSRILGACNPPLAHQRSRKRPESGCSFPATSSFKKPRAEMLKLRPSIHWNPCRKSRILASWASPHK